MLARCIRATERGSRLTARLLTLGQRQSLHPEPMDVAAFLAEFGELVRRTLPSSIQVSIDTSENLPPIHVDQAMLQDALLNLVVNARDAMPSGGTLAISAVRDGEASEVALMVADAGDGMPADIRKKVFEPFFTTKGVGKGSGLGLSMVRGFVEQSGGRIILESAPDQGTTITIFLPIACPNEVERLEPVETAEVLQRGQGETILLVEDDDDVRSSMESILLYLGYTVRSAANADEALRVLNESRARIALVISDIVMPGDLHGDDLAIVIGERYAGLPVVLMSGYAEQGVRQDVLDREIPLLTKPVATETLQQALHEKLSSSNRTIGDSSNAHFDS
jgi:CheY-like chemotaxis protein